MPFKYADAPKASKFQYVDEPRNAIDIVTGAAPGVAGAPSRIAQGLIDPLRSMGVMGQDILLGRSIRDIIPPIGNNVQKREFLPEQAKPSVMGAVTEALDRPAIASEISGIQRGAIEKPEQYKNFGETMRTTPEVPVMDALALLGGARAARRPIMKAAEIPGAEPLPASKAVAPIEDYLAKSIVENPEVKQVAKEAGYVKKAGTAEKIEKEFDQTIGDAFKGLEEAKKSIYEKSGVKDTDPITIIGEKESPYAKMQEAITDFKSTALQSEKGVVADAEGLLSDMATRHMKDGVIEFGTAKKLTQKLHELAESESAKGNHGAARMYRSMRKALTDARDADIMRKTASSDYAALKDIEEQMESVFRADRQEMLLSDESGVIESSKMFTPARRVLRWWQDTGGTQQFHGQLNNLFKALKANEYTKNLPDIETATRKLQLAANLTKGKPRTIASIPGMSKMPILGGLSKLTVTPEYMAKTIAKNATPGSLRTSVPKRGTGLETLTMLEALMQATRGRVPIPLVERLPIELLTKPTSATLAAASVARRKQEEK